MQLLGFLARYYLFALATFLTFFTLTDWIATRRINFAMAWGLWNIPIVRMATLASIGLIFLNYCLTGERGGWDIGCSQTVKGDTGPGAGSAGGGADP